MISLLDVIFQYEAEKSTSFFRDYTIFYKYQLLFLGHWLIIMPW